jgi:PAS domain S-box-containing protein
MSFTDIIHPDSLEHCSEVFSQVLAGASFERIEAKCQRRSGEVILLEGAIGGRLENGKLVATRAMLRDVTAIKAAEEALQESVAATEAAQAAAEDRYVQLYQHAPVMTLTTAVSDDGPLIVDCNEMFSRRMGYSRDELRGTRLSSILTEPSAAAMLSDGYATSLERPQAELSRQLIDADGGIIDALLYTTPLRTDEGEATGTRAMYVDITDRERLRVASETAARELQQLIDTANAPIFGVDTQGRVTEWNQAAARITGFNKDEVMGHDLVHDFIEEDTRPAVQAVLDNALRGEETSNFELPLVAKDGRRITVLLNATTRRNVNRHIVGVIGVGQDITEAVVYREMSAAV